MSISTVIRSGLIAAVSLAMVSTDLFAQREHRGHRGGGGDSGGRSIGRSFGGGDGGRSIGRSFGGGDGGRSSSHSFRGGDSGRSFSRSFGGGDSGRSIQRSLRSGDSSRSFGRSLESRNFRGPSNTPNLQNGSGQQRTFSRSLQDQFRSRSTDSNQQRQLRSGDGNRSRIDPGRRLLGNDRPTFPQKDNTQRETFRQDNEGRFLRRDGDSNRVLDFGRRDGGDRDRDWRERSRDWSRRDWDNWFGGGGFARNRDWDFDRRDRHHRDWHHGHWQHRNDLAWYLLPFFWSSGYGTGYYPYYNPYYSSDVFVGGPIYDYSQPLVVHSYDDSLSDAQTRALQRFDVARSVFEQGDYERSLAEVDAALRVMPDDPVLHEFRAVVLFAMARYEESAATIYAVLAAGPGWDWSTLADLYPNVSVYTQQLRSLEAYVREHPNSAQARFLLGYHYMTAGHTDAAANQFQRVVQLQPEDRVTPQLLKMLSGENQSAPTGEGPGASDPPALPAPPNLPGARPAATFDAGAMAGSWTASRDDGSSFALALGDDGQFTWRFKRDGKTENLEGTYTAAGDRLILEPEVGGVMVARISDVNNDKFRFVLVGGPADDPGLVFQKESR